MPNTNIPITDMKHAALRSDVVDSMRALYEQADQLIAAQPATCWNKGECCRFGQFGHRLYVTTLEAAYYLSQGDSPPPITEDACPHAHEGKCHARDRRPLGCRIFYCDPAATHWQGPLTEQLLDRLRQMHAELEVPYVYADWMSVVQAIREDAAT